MEIGTKIREARVRAKITQERAAEEIGVSRQTLSNWENAKTYPDIMSVVKMSDLYGVSLDHLLKEPSSDSEYVHYLDERTNLTKKRDQQMQLTLAMVYFVFWCAALIYFWVLSPPDGAFFYGMVFQWILFPVVTFVISILIGMYPVWGRWTWLCALLLGVMYMIADYLTFPLANMLTGGSISYPNPVLIFSIAGVSLIGWGLGRLFTFLKK